MANETFIQALSQRILILDGAMGTQLQLRGLKGNNESFNLSHPDVIRSIHEAYIAAGADIIETNTFGANRLTQGKNGCAREARQFALEGARLARAAADAAPRKVWVAGSMGPTGESLTLSQYMPLPDSASYEDLTAAYAEQVQALVEGGVDLLLLETCFDELNAKAAVEAIDSNPQASALPLMISLSVDSHGRTLTGLLPADFYRNIQFSKPLCFGLNCSQAADALFPFMVDVAAWCDCAVSCYPNAGLPNWAGEYDQTPQEMADALGRMARQGLLNVAGGCCGTTPEHIRAIAQAVSGCAPRSR